MCYLTDYDKKSKSVTYIKQFENFRYSSIWKVIYFLESGALSELEDLNILISRVQRFERLAREFEVVILAF